MGLEDYLSRLGAHEFRFVGSNLKFCKIAEGVADLYPCLGPTYEWETAAAQYIVEAVGGEVIDLRGEPMRYNTKASLLNPTFLVYADTLRDWSIEALESQALQKLKAA